MRSFALAVLLLFLIASTALSQVPDDKLIVPGVRIGNWTLGMALSDLVRTLGQAIVIPLHTSDDMVSNPGVMTYVWGFSLLDASTRDGKTVEWLDLVFRTEFKTAQGIGIGSRLPEVQAAYGKPTAETTPNSYAPAGKRLIYDEMGLSLNVGFIGRDVVSAVTIFRPGTAKAIYKF